MVCSTSTLWRDGPLSKRVPIPSLHNRNSPALSSRRCISNPLLRDLLRPVCNSSSKPRHCQDSAPRQHNNSRRSRLSRPSLPPMLHLQACTCILLCMPTLHMLSNPLKLPCTVVCTPLHNKALRHLIQPILLRHTTSKFPSYNNPHLQLQCMATIPMPTSKLPPSTSSLRYTHRQRHGQAGNALRPWTCRMAFRNHSSELYPIWTLMRRSGCSQALHTTLLLLRDSKAT